MQTENRHVKIFQPLLKAVAEDRQRADKTALVVASYAGAIIKMWERIQQMQQLAPKVLKSREGEILYFREIWPRMFGHLFYYQKVYGLLSQRTHVPAGELASVCVKEEAEVARFFDMNREFWQNYTARLAIMDGQFTREYSMACIFDPLCMVICPAGATLASYKAAWGLAYEEYKVVLTNRIADPVTPPPRHKHRWLESRTAALELLKAQEEAGSIEVDGARATMGQLVEDFEDRYDFPLKDYNKLLYAATGRKIVTAPYLSKLMASFNGRKARLRK